MKTFNQFCTEAYQLNEFQIGNPLNNPMVKKVTSKINPLFRNLDRIENIATTIGATPDKKDVVSRAAAAYGIIRPLSLPSMAPDIVKQGQSGSLTDKVARSIPGMTTNPKTDLARRAGTALMDFARGKPITPAPKGPVKIPNLRNIK